MTDTQAVIRLAQQARQLQGLQRGQYVQNVVQSNVIDPRTKAAVMRLYGKFSPHPDMVAQTLNPTSRK